MTVKFPMKQRTLLKTVAKGGFLSSRLVRWKLLKKLPWSHWQARWVWRLFYIMLLQCILLFHQQQSVSLCTIMPHYVKKLRKKNYWHESLCERVFVPKTMTVIFFGALAKEWHLKCKILFLLSNENQQLLEMKLVKFSN